MAWTPWEKVAGFDFQEVIYEKKYHVELEGGIARITMNPGGGDVTRTGRGMMQEVEIAFRDASEDPMIGVVVYTGVGDRDFAAARIGGGPGGGVGGRIPREADMMAAAKNVPEVKTGDKEDRGNEWRKIPAFIPCSKPVIARVNGYCVGNGYHQAMACDITIAAEHAIFAHNGPRTSSPAGGGYVSYETYLVGAKRAREANFTCFRYDAQEAYERGLINKVVRFEKLDEEVDKWCEQILRASPTCIEIRKASFDIQIGYGVQPMYVLANRMVPNYPESPDAAEGGAAFRENRLPRFWKFRKAELEAKKKEG